MNVGSADVSVDWDVHDAVSKTPLSPAETRPSTPVESSNKLPATPGWYPVIGALLELRHVLPPPLTCPVQFSSHRHLLSTSASAFLFLSQMLCRQATLASPAALPCCLLSSRRQQKVHDEDSLPTTCCSSLCFVWGSSRTYLGRWEGGTRTCIYVVWVPKTCLCGCVG